MLALLATLACWTAPAQGLAPQLSALDGARLELAREARFAAQWQSAPPERRAAARARLLRLKTERALAVTTSTDRAVALAQAWRELLGGPFPTEDGGALAAAVDALDLRVVPGGFSARDEGLGEAMTIHVRPLFEVDIDVPVELSLYWRSQADGSEVRARTEPIAPDVFTTDGFEMYVRPPVSAPGRYELVPELSIGEQRVRGFPTWVDCAAELGPRARALDELARDERGLTHELREGLAPRLLYGARTLDALPFEDALRLGLGDGTPAGPVRVVEGPGGAPLWSRAGVDAPRPRALLIAVAAPEHPTDVLNSPAGAAWEQLARELDVQLIATTRPALTNGGPDLLDLLRELRARPGLEELTVVARGETGILLPSRLRGEEGAELVDRLLVQASLACRPPPLFGLSLPVLSVDSLAEQDDDRAGVDGVGRWCWLRRELPGPVLEGEVPGLYRAWLEGALDEPTPEGGRAPK